MQRWRRELRGREQGAEGTREVLGHEVGEGCDFCDALRVEGDEEAIVEEEEGEGEEEDDDGSETLRDSDSETVMRAMEEESIITGYLDSSRKTESAGEGYRDGSVDDWGVVVEEEEEEERQVKVEENIMELLAGMGGEERVRAKQKRASEWARSYRGLVGRGPGSKTTLQFERYPEVGTC